MSMAAYQMPTTTLGVIFASDAKMAVWGIVLASSNSKDLDFRDVEDGSEAVERVARTTNPELKPELRLRRRQQRRYSHHNHHKLGVDHPQGGDCPSRRSSRQTLLASLLGME